MFELHSLLTAIDVDASTGRILETASQLAKRSDGARHFLCHAVDPISPVYERLLFPYACFGDDREALISELLARAESIVDQRFKRNRDAIGSHSLTVTYGSPAEAIVAQARSVGPDLIVAGANASDSPAYPRLGHVARELATRASVPTLLIRRTSGDVGYQRVAVSLDFSEASTGVLEFAVQVTSFLDAELKAIHVIPSIDHLDHAGYLSGRGAKSNEAVRKSADKNFQKTAANMKLPFPIRERIESVLRTPTLLDGDPGPAIVKYLDECAVDLVVLAKCRDIAGSGLRLGRTAAYIASHAPSDVLLIPPPPARPSTD